MLAHRLDIGPSARCRDLMPLFSSFARVPSSRYGGSCGLGRFGRSPTTPHFEHRTFPDSFFDHLRTVGFQQCQRQLGRSACTSCTGSPTASAAILMLLRPSLYQRLPTQLGSSHQQSHSHCHHSRFHPQPSRRHRKGLCLLDQYQPGSSLDLPTDSSQSAPTRPA